MEPNLDLQSSFIFFVSPEIVEEASFLEKDLDMDISNNKEC